MTKPTFPHPEEDAAILACADIVRHAICGCPLTPAPVGRLLHALNAGARRLYRFHPPGCRHVSADERALAGLLQAAQAGDADSLDARAAWLARPAHRAGLVHAAEETAEMLLLYGQILPAQTPRRPASDIARPPALRLARSA